MPGANRHLVTLTDAVIEWRYPFSGAGLPPNCVFFGEVLRELERLLPDHGLTFVLTRAVDRLPVPADQRTVVIIVEDEWCRWPEYAPQVLACFKVFGTRSTHLQTVPFGLDALFVTSVLQRLRVAVRTAGNRWARQRARLAGSPDNVLDVPVGSGHTVDVPLAPLSERPWDVAFLGSVDNGNTGGAWRRFLDSPKTIARTEMLQTLEQVARRRPDLRILTAQVDGYHAAVSSDPVAYSEALASAKIALVPRGTNPETFRYFEAHRLGAVPVSEPLPRRDFYSPDPRLVVRRWRDLPAVLDRLLGPGGRPTAAAEQEQERIRRVWESHYSPPVVAADMCRFIRRMEAGAR